VKVGVISGLPASSRIKHNQGHGALRKRTASEAIHALALSDGSSSLSKHPPIPLSHIRPTMDSGRRERIKDFGWQAATVVVYECHEADAQCGFSNNVLFRSSML